MLPSNVVKTYRQPAAAHGRHFPRPQHLLKRCADLSVHCTPQLVAAMRAAVHSVLQGLQLQQPVSSDMAMGLLSHIHRGAARLQSLAQHDFQEAPRPGCVDRTQCRLVQHVVHVNLHSRCLGALRTCVRRSADKLPYPGAEFETAAAAVGWQPFLLPGSDEDASPQVCAMPECMSLAITKGCAGGSIQSHAAVVFNFTTILNAAAGVCHAGGGAARGGQRRL